MRHGRRREYRPVNDALTNDGFVGGLKAMEMIGEETAAILPAVIEAKDHRLLAAVLNALAEHLENGAAER